MNSSIRRTFFSIALFNVIKRKSKRTSIGGQHTTCNMNNGEITSIGTHDGVFHCDEVLGCYMLKVLYPMAKIVRSRDKSILDKCDIVIDVGGVYNPTIQRFDHHQRDFHHTMNTLSTGVDTARKCWDTKLSSAGLIYYHYGKQVLNSILAQQQEEELLNYVYDKMYVKFIQEIDAIDNGIPMFDGEPSYYINSDLCTRVSKLNMPWNMNKDDYNVKEHFEKAIQLVGNEFVDTIHGLSKIAFPARKIVSDAIKMRHNIYQSGEIIQLPIACPWKTHFFELESELGVQPGQIKFVIFPGNDDYRVQAVSFNEKSFVCRKFLHEKWRGLRDQILCETAGIQGCIFVHANGFIGGNVSNDGAFQMAVNSLKY